MNFILKVPKLCELKSSSYIHLVQRNENVGFKFWEISTKEIQKFADKFPNFSEQEVGVKNAAPWYLIYISTIYYSLHIIQKFLFCFLDMCSINSEPDYWGRCVLCVLCFYFSMFSLQISGFCFAFNLFDLIWYSENRSSLFKKCTFKTDIWNKNVASIIHEY